MKGVKIKGAVALRREMDELDSAFERLYPRGVRRLTHAEATEENVALARRSLFCVWLMLHRGLTPEDVIEDLLMRARTTLKEVNP